MIWLCVSRENFIFSYAGNAIGDDIRHATSISKQTHFHNSKTLKAEKTQWERKIVWATLSHFLFVHKFSLAGERDLDVVLLLWGRRYEDGR